MSKIIALLLCLACTLAVYWPGLSGGMMLDDDINFEQLQRYLKGEVTLPGVIFTNGSGTLGRSLSMATFVANVATTGDALWPMKFTNLLLHLACGVLLSALLIALLRRDSSLRRFDAGKIALLLAALWLVMPIQVSTVLYIVQRMTQLSSLFILVALLTYVHGRQRIEERRPGATWLLFLAFPLATALAILAKENGVLAPLFALVIEISYFGRGSLASAQRRKVWAFFALFLVIPVAVGLIAMAAQPTRWLSSYALRDFTLVERLLTEPRILWDYVGLIVLPNGPRMGLIHDNFPLSHGLFDPASTAIAILGWLGVIALGVKARRKGHPALLFGALFFLAGHVLESTILPLELYFEHRNYLCSIGILVWVAGAIALVVDLLPMPSTSLRRAAPLLVAALFGLMCLATLARTRVWAWTPLVYEQGLKVHPDSPRLHRLLAASFLLDGDLDSAKPHLEKIAELRPNDRAAVAVLGLLGYCTANREPPQLLFDQALEAPRVISIAGVNAFTMLASRVETDKCAALSTTKVIDVGERWLAANTLPKTSVNSWKVKYHLAKLYASLHQWQLAIRLATEAWRESGSGVNTATLVFQLNATVGAFDACRAVLTEMKTRNSGWDLTINRAIQDFDSFLASHDKTLKQP